MADPKFPFLVEPYSVLSAVYDRAGFADFARNMIPRYLNYAFSIDWAGRTVLDLGCGTGFTSLWLADQGYRVAAVDNNPNMIKIARNRTRGPALEVPEYAESDIRQLESPIGPADLVLAVGSVLNAIQSLRELETVFNNVNKALQPGKL
ncbi:MAG: class I SAM-dependent methyltransferase, partial [Anaerolineae bacterium]|nr:class I SAM-dependent methyltransferase [Anaerolineae bacterium]